MSPDYPANSSTPVAASPSLGVTEKALRKIAAERTKRNQPDLLFRVTVLGGGCSGFQYKLGYEANPAGEDDIIFPDDTPAVITDTTSLRLLNGASLDYEQDLMGARFAIKNPNAVSGCGCGVSFSIDFSKIG